MHHYVTRSAGPWKCIFCVAAVTYADFAVLGCNLEDGPWYGNPMYNGITDAVKQNLLNISTVRESVKPLFYTRMRLGLFDTPTFNPYAKLDPKKVNIIIIYSLS